MRTGTCVGARRWLSITIDIFSLIRKKRSFTTVLWLQVFYAETTTGECFSYYYRLNDILQESG